MASVYDQPSSLLPLDSIEPVAATRPVHPGTPSPVTAHSLRNAAARLKAIKLKDDIVSINAKFANPATEEDGALVDLYGDVRDGDTPAGESSLPYFRSALALPFVSFIPHLSSRLSFL
jgi:hypothetical protein